MSSDSQTPLQPQSSAENITRWQRLVPPSFAVLIFLCMPGTVLVRPNTMLTDPGMGWHLKTGEYILSTGTVPQHDLFSFTMPGAPWVTYEWLFQLLAATLTALGGLPLLSAASALVYGALPVLLYLQMLRRGSNIAIAAVFAILSELLLTGHAHARPHILTYLFFLLLADRLARFDRGEIAARSLLWFVPLSAVWANLHGGFIIGPVLVALYVVGTALKMAGSRPNSGMPQLRTYATLGVGMGLASLLNPAGWNLHFSILEYLSSDSLALMAEYQSPDFGSGSAAVLLFGFLVLGLVLILGARRTSLDLTECLLLVFFLYQSFSAVRHVFLFALIAVPILAVQLTEVLDVAWPWARRKCADIAQGQARLASNAIYFPVVIVAFLTLSLTAQQLFRTDLDDIFLSSGAAEFMEARTGEWDRMFNTDQLGGALVYRFWPDIKIFGDDRNDFYGDEFVIDKYAHVLTARADWQNVLDEYAVTSAIVLRNEVAGTLFRTSPDWEMIYQDALNEIYTRTTSPAVD